MTKAERIAALLKHEHNTVKDLKTLETVSEDFLTILETQATANGEQSAKHAAELKTAQDKQAETDAKLKAAEAAQIPAEELVTLRALGAAKQAADTAEKVSLVTKLVAASKALTKEQLETKTLDDLKTLAAFAKIETVDYSIKGIPTPRAAQTPLTEYAPPDPYAAELKALKAVN